MHRSLAAAMALSWLTTPGVVAQNFQFMQLTPRTPTSLVPLQWRFFGYAVGDDFDGNGYCDLLATSEFGVAQFMGTPNGFVAGSPLAWAEQRPRLVDLDGDGDRDVAFVPPQLIPATPVLLYQNTPSGLASVALPSALNVPVQGVALGDIDANGFVDMVITKPVGSVTPSLMLARGGGPGVQFTLDTTSMPTGLPFALWPELIDADGDGDLDVLATNAVSGLRLLHNVGGSFVDATATLPPVRMGHIYLMKADFDGDGRDDCAATHMNGELDMLWGGASGLTFRQAISSTLRQGFNGLWPADFDGDGDLDILADDGTGLDVLWNQGNRQFTRGDIVRPHAQLRGTADINGDGRMDVVYALQASSRVVRCRFAASSEDGGSAAGIRTVVGTQMAPSAAGDVDGDGRSDVVTPQSEQITVDHALGGGLYRRANLPLVNYTIGRPWRTQLADMDRDGDLDLVVRDDAKVSIADNNGAGAFAWSLQRASTRSVQDDLRLGDVDADGDLDIVYADPLGVMLIRNNGGQYAPPTTIVSQVPGHCVELADVDGDNDLDVIAASLSAHVILANNGAGIFAPNPAFAVAPGVFPWSLRAGDFDGDGDQDLAVADTAPRLHRNNGNGSFTETTASDLPPFADGVLSNLVAADLDADGDLDLSAVTTGNPPLLLLINDGTGRFSDRSAARVQPFSGGGPTWRLGASDYDDDGDVDLIVEGGSLQTVLVNHLRHCRSNASLRLGNVADFHLVSGPNFGQPGLGLLGVGFALAAPPLQFAGLAGQLELDPATLQIVAAVTTSPVGVSSAFVPVPQDPLLFALEVWFQGAILPPVGPAGFTNATSEIIGR